MLVNYMLVKMQKLPDQFRGLWNEEERKEVGTSSSSGSTSIFSPEKPIVQVIGTWSTDSGMGSRSLSLNTVIWEMICNLGIIIRSIKTLYS